MGHALSRSLRGLLVTFILLFAVSAAGAQETSQIGRLNITDSNTDSAPSVQLRVYGMDGQGNPIDFAVEPLFLTHDGFPVDEVVFDGKTPVGTLTVFLIDAAGGTADQIPAIENAIRQFAGSGNMQEQLDFVAVYQIRAAGPQQLLAPTQFYNGVNNLFNTTDLVAEEGSTALYDSVMGLIGEIAGLKPDPAMAASIVLISDGTDPGTSQAQPADVPRRAADAGVPIHTLHLENPALGVGLELGRTYMRDVATGSRGVAAELASPEGLAAVWARIAGFREQSFVRYTIPQPAGGSFPVELSLENNRDTRATTEVNISTVAPNVVINLPRESRSLTLPDLEEPVDLQLSTTVSWLDGQARDVTAAQLLVNGAPVADIPASDLASFGVSIGNFIFGDNRLEVSVTDSQGLTSVSPPVIITVSEGEEVALPEELQPSGGFNPIWLLWLAALAGLGVVGLWLWRRRTAVGEAASGGGRSRRRRRAPPPAYPPPTDAGFDAAQEAVYPGAAPPEAPSPFVMAHLEILDAQTDMPAEFTLGDAEVRIGRSPTQAQLAFRNDITVSRYHAVLRLEGSHYRIYDAGSTSGTYVNDRQVPEYGLQLSDGDYIQLGAVRLRYRQI
jgi:hypothetical protein